MSFVVVHLIELYLDIDLIPFSCFLYCLKLYRLLVIHLFKPRQVAHQLNHLWELICCQLDSSNRLLIAFANILELLDNLGEFIMGSVKKYHTTDLVSIKASVQIQILRRVLCDWYLIFLRNKSERNSVLWIIMAKSFSKSCDIKL